MGGLADFLAWQANTPEADKVSSIATTHHPMSADEYQRLHPNTVEDMNRMAIVSSGDTVLRIGCHVTTSLGRDPRGVNNE